MLEAAGTYILENKEWIFSGIGIFVITTVFLFIRHKKSSGHRIKQVQKSGDSSVSVQIGNIEK